MKNGAKDVTLGECTDMLAGFAFKSRDFTDDPDNVPLIKGENVSQGRILWEKSKYWRRDQISDYEKFQLRPGDVVLAMDRPWVPAGLKWAYIRDDDPESLLVQRVTRLRAKEGIDQTFLRYVVGSPKFEKYIIPITTGVNVPHISGKQIGSFRFQLPNLPTQRRIAGILSAYDNLIENNLRRIRILEEMAKSLYREWFVHFRFPGHESVPLVDSPLGPIPEGWEATLIEDVCSRVTDGSHSSPKSVDHGMPMASSKDMHAFGLDLESARQIGREDYEKLVRNGCQPKKNDILITKDGANYLKYIFVVEKDTEVVLLSSIAILTPNDRIDPHFFAAVLNCADNKERLKNYVTGAAIPRIILKDFKRFQFLLPPEEIQQAWAKIGGFTTELCWDLVAKNQILRRTRGLILPKLLALG